MMLRDPYKALYLHIPFCKQRCDYCDFTTNAVLPDDPIVKNYVENLILQIRRAAKKGDLAELETVYLGGGTPSYLGQKHLTEILYMLGLSVNLTDDMEVSMEANPDSVSAPLIKDIWALGVNRLSIGVQTFDRDLLQIIGRVHSSEQARRAIELAHERFDNVSVDLMCGIPYQTMDAFLHDLECALDAGVAHLSIYPLTVEPGTPLAKSIRRKKLPDVDEDLQADMMQAAARFLAERGFSRYEVASYAKPGYECRHNISYWTGVPYLGLGHSAVTMMQDASRRVRLRDDCLEEDLNLAQMTAEDLILGMRLSQGISDEHAQRAQIVLEGVFNTLEHLAGQGLIVHSDGRWRPTERGWLFGNVVYGSLFELGEE